MSRHAGPAPALLAALALAGQALAGPQGPEEPPVSWQLRADATAQVEHYDVSGPPGASPYSFLGTQGFGQLNVFFDRQQGRYKSWRGQFFGLVNDSDYRDPHDGVVVERMSFVVQDGLAALPYRLEIGDGLAYLSNRSLFRTIKGVRLEIQSPRSQRIQSSLQFLSGVSALSWRDLRLKDDYTNALSWLVGVPRVANFTANFVDTLLAPQDAVTSRNQRLYGLAAERSLRAGSDFVNLEAEAIHLTESIERTGGGPTTDTDAESYYAQVRGSGRSPVFYRARFEQSGRGYLPAGAPVIADRRLSEGHLGFRLPGGSRVQGRLLRYRDFRESVDPADTTTAGATFSGPFVPGALPGFLGNVDFFVQSIDNRSATLDTRIATLTADAYRSQARGWMPRVRFFWQDKDDRLGDGDRSTAELFAGVDRSFGLGGFTGIVGPGVLVRRLEEGDERSDDWQPTLNVTLAKGGHLFQESFGFLDQDREDGIEDLRTLDLRLLYRYTRRADSFGLEVDGLSRDPAPGALTRSLAAKLSWTHRFDTGRRGALPLTLGAPGRAPVGPVTDVAQIAPGLLFDEASASLRTLGSPSRLGRLAIWEARLLPDIDRRQRLVLVEEGGVVKTAALVIEAGDTGDGDSFRQAFEDVRRALVARYGEPSVTFEQGDFGPGLTEDVGTGAFVRVSEWVRPEGVLRFGVPRRIDRQVRMELQFAAEFPSLRETLWSIEEAR